MYRLPVHMNVPEQGLGNLLSYMVIKNQDLYNFQYPINFRHKRLNEVFLLNSTIPFPYLNLNYKSLETNLT